MTEDDLKMIAALVQHMGQKIDQIAGSALSPIGQILIEELKTTSLKLHSIVSHGSQVSEPALAPSTPAVPKSEFVQAAPVATASPDPYAPPVPAAAFVAPAPAPAPHIAPAPVAQAYAAPVAPAPIAQAYAAPMAPAPVTQVYAAPVAPAPVAQAYAAPVAPAPVAQAYAAAPAPAPLAVAPAPAQDPAAAAQAQKKVLFLIDDDKDAQKVLAYMFERKSSFRVVSHTDPLKAWEEIKQSPPDLILMDLMMPGISGLDLLKNIRQINELRNVKILIGSSKSFDKDRIEVLKAGANDFIAKPYNFTELLLRLNKLAG